MSGKKIINSPANCTEEALYGLCSSHSRLTSSDRNIFDMVALETQKTAVVSGGGSGHEPFPAGYVGGGMLTASVSGPVFTSPAKHQILKAIRKLAECEKGIFLIIPNYTGDRLNFGLAMEVARNEGIQIDSVVVGEDVALMSRGNSTKSGRRGMCGLVLVIKVAGFLSREGMTLKEIKNATEVMTQNLASFGLCIESCSMPGSSGFLFNLAPDEAELGVGVHGEAGVSKIKLTSAKETVKILLDPILQSLQIGKDDEVVAVVNNLGGLSQIEQWIITGEVEKYLTEKQVKLQRLYAGLLFTSLNMVGVQVCLLKLNPEMKEMYLRAFDAATDAPAWPGTILCVPISTFISPETENQRPRVMVAGGQQLKPNEATILEKCLKQGSELIIEYEKYLNYLDSGCGDGDCGTTLGRFAKEILHDIKENKLKLSNPAEAFDNLGEIAENTMGGTSGAIYGLFLLGVSDALSSHSVVDASAWSEAWEAGLNTIKKHSLARKGDRTLLDALEPACETFKTGLEKCGPNIVKIFTDVVESALEGCNSTRYMKASIGRASYVDETELKEMDAGAFGVVLWLRGIREVLEVLETC